MPHDTGGERLLETARDLLRDQLLPLLPEPQRHAALMVANAMAIAARQLNRHADTALVEARTAQARQLCASIRAGQADSGAAAAQVHAQLLASTRAHVEISNPKVLVQQTRPGP